MNRRWGVRYPISGVHECMYGLEQAKLVQLLAIREGILAELVESRDEGKTWNLRSAR